MNYKETGKDVNGHDCGIYLDRKGNCHTGPILRDAAYFTQDHKSDLICGLTWSQIKAQQSS